MSTLTNNNYRVLLFRYSIGCHLTYMLYFVINFILSKFFSWRVPHNLKNWVHFGLDCFHTWLLTSLQMSTKNQMCLKDVLLVTFVSPFLNYGLSLYFVSLEINMQRWWSVWISCWIYLVLKRKKSFGWWITNSRMRLNPYIILSIL